MKQNGINKSKALGVIFSLLFIVMFSCSKENDSISEHEPGLKSYSIQVEGYKRDYNVYVPEKYNHDVSVSMVIVLHGGGGTASNVMAETKWHEKANEVNFLAIFPEAIPPDTTKPSHFSDNPQTWNDGSNRFHSGEHNIPDVDFIDRMIDDLIQKFNINQEQIFATGFSNGASMAFRIGIELAEQIRAIAPVAGALWIENPVLKKPISLLYITGSEDTFNPLEGGVPTTAYGTVIDDTPKPPVMEHIQTWSNMLNCSTEPVNINVAEGVSGIRFESCDQQTEVVLVIVDGLGHHWPGGVKQLPEWFAGPYSDKLIATDFIWEFFEKSLLHTIEY